MDLFGNLALGFSVALTPFNLLCGFLGVLVGTLVGVLPGIGPIGAIALLLPTTFGLDPISALIMLAGIYYGSQYGGSTTAILLNLPGESASAVTTIDGYQMARRGRAGPALFAAGIGSFFAGTVATLIIALFALPLTELALKFGPAEYFSLMVLGLILSVALASGSVIKSIAMIVVGLLLGLVGSDIYTGSSRFTLGFLELEDGLNFVALSVGLFGLVEIFRNLENESAGKVSITKINGLLPSKEDVKRMIAPILRGTLIGSALGVLPGGSAVLSSFAGYTIEKKVSKNSAEFGHGAIEGVAAPESANNAAAQTSFIPMLSLGIPGNATMALMYGAMIIHGITPGPTVATSNPELFWGLIVSMWLGNLALIVLNLPLVGIWVKLLTIPYYVMFPAIIAFCVIGVYSVGYNAFDLYQVTLFGLAGYLLMRLRCEPAPLVLGFVLGPMFEDHLRRAMLLSRGDPTVFVTRPISATILLLAVVALVIVSMPAAKKRRESMFVDED